MIKLREPLFFLDLETTGVILDKHQILQLAILFVDINWTIKEFSRNVEYENYIVTRQALQINNINLANHDGCTLEKLDRDVVEFIQDCLMHDPIHDASLNNSIMTIGFNVGSFDNLFIKRSLPKLSKLLSYRSVDLNSLIYLDAIKKGLCFKENKDLLFNDIEMSHNALEDCKVSLEIFKKLLYTDNE